MGWQFFEKCCLKSEQFEKKKKKSPNDFGGSICIYLPNECPGDYIFLLRFNELFVKKKKINVIKSGSG